MTFNYLLINNLNIKTYAAYNIVIKLYYMCFNENKSLIHSIIPSYCHCK